MSEDYEEYEDNDPCEDCGRDCDGWDMQYCCLHCGWVFDGNTPCDSCDPMDI